MKTVFILQHSYEINDCDETKFIGVYSTIEKAQESLGKTKLLKGFNRYPNNFFISEYIIDDNNWIEGFATVVAINVRDNFQKWHLVTAEFISDNSYQIIDNLNEEFSQILEFKPNDIVECNEINGELFAKTLIKKANQI